MSSSLTRWDIDQLLADVGAVFGQGIGASVKDLGRAAGIEPGEVGLRDQVADRCQGTGRGRAMGISYAVDVGL
jgi:hypothetical protein